MGKRVESSKKISSLKLNAASHNNASWYTDLDGFLEHSPSQGSLYYKGFILQKIIPGFWGPPSYICVCICLSVCINTKEKEEKGCKAMP